MRKRERVLPRAHFNEQHFSEHTDILSVLRETNKKWLAIHDKLSALEREAQSVITDWHAEKNAADWMQTLETDMEAVRVIIHRT